MDAELYDRLREAQVEAENSKHEAYKESLKRQKAERDAIDALRKVKLSQLFSNFHGISSIIHSSAILRHSVSIGAM